MVQVDYSINFSLSPQLNLGKPQVVAQRIIHQQRARHFTHSSNLSFMNPWRVIVHLVIPVYIIILIIWLAPWKTIRNTHLTVGKSSIIHCICFILFRFQFLNIFISVFFPLERAWWKSYGSEKAT